MEWKDKDTILFRASLYGFRVWATMDGEENTDLSPRGALGWLGWPFLRLAILFHQMSNGICSAVGVEHEEGFPLKIYTAEVKEMPDDIGADGLEFHTMKEWNKLGFKVRKGEKATGQKNGEATFTEEQVED